MFYISKMKNSKWQNVLGKIPYFLCLNWLLLKLDYAADIQHLFVHVCVRACVCVYYVHEYRYVCGQASVCTSQAMSFQSFYFIRTNCGCTGTVTQNQKVTSPHAPIAGLFLFVYYIYDTGLCIYIEHPYSKPFFSRGQENANTRLSCMLHGGLLLYWLILFFDLLKYNFDFQFWGNNFFVAFNISRTHLFVPKMAYFIYTHKKIFIYKRMKAYIQYSVCTILDTQFTVLCVALLVASECFLLLNPHIHENGWNKIKRKKCLKKKREKEKSQSNTY